MQLYLISLSVNILAPYTSYYYFAAVCNVQYSVFNMSTIESPAMTVQHRTTSRSERIFVHLGMTGWSCQTYAATSLSMETIFPTALLPSMTLHLQRFSSAIQPWCMGKPQVCGEVFSESFNYHKSFYPNVSQKLRNCQFFFKKKKLEKN